MEEEHQPPEPGEVPVPLDGVDGDPARLLSLARDRHRARVIADRDVFLAAAVWAEMHGQDSITEADWVAGGDTAHPIAGAGCPLVAEFSIAEFAAVVGRSTDSGRRLIGQAVECRHRLPRLWARVTTGGLEAWRAGQIADATMALNASAAAFVDTQVACVAHKVGPTQLGRLIGEAIARFDPDLAEREADQSADGRCLNVRFGQSGGLGLPGTQASIAVDGILDFADARDLDLAVRQGAAELAALGSEESLAVRRSQALGVLARHDLTLDLNGDPTPDPTPTTGTGPDPEREAAPGTEPDPAPAKARRPVRTVRPRQVVIYAHLSADVLGPDITGGPRPGCDLARVEGHGWVTADQVRTWCGPDTQVIIRPVIDTTDCISVDAYEIPDRLRDQVISRDPACVFPWCHRPARTADCDHVTAHGDGGPTCSCNLAPLCRRHHRIKTHTGWSYDLVDTGTYLWVSPHGHRFRRDPTGTTLLDRGCGCGRPDPPSPDPDPTEP